MRMEGVNNMGTGMQTRMSQGTDATSKNIQNQIQRLQQEQQKFSENEEMSIEDKMKKRQEIQQEIASLNQQLRQHQIEQRKEQQSKGASMNDESDGSRNLEKNAGGLSQASMQAMICADTSIKQAKVQGSMATQMEGKAGVLESEIKMDKGRGASTEKKEEELADLQEKARAATAAQISKLADANKVMEEAAASDQNTGTSKSRDVNTDKTEETEGKEKTDNSTENVSGSVNTETIVTTSETAVSDAPEAETVQPASPQVHYTSVDIRL